MSSPLFRSLLVTALALPALPALAAVDFAACFRLDPGVSWSSGGERTSIIQTELAGEPALAVASSEGGVTVANVFAPNGRELLATVRYGIAAWGGDAAAPVMTDSFDPAPGFPATATPGQRFSVAGKGVRHHHADQTDTPIDYDGFSDYTFIGFEDLEVEIDYQPHTFKDTCHLSAAVEGGRVEAWYAPGLGRIKFQRYSGEDLLFSDEIDSIESP